MSCNDIILTFLEDIAQDVNWDDNFQFQDTKDTNPFASSFSDHSSPAVSYSLPVRPTNDTVVASSSTSPPCSRSLSATTKAVPPNASVCVNKLRKGTVTRSSVRPTSSSSLPIYPTPCAIDESVLPNIMNSGNDTPPHTGTTTSSTVDSPGFSECSSSLGNISSTDSSHSGSDYEELEFDFEKQLVNIDWGVGAKDLVFKSQSDPHSYVHQPSELKLSSAKGGKSREKKVGLNGGKKRKYETAAKKKERLSAEEMLICVVNFLRNKNKTVKGSDVTMTRGSLRQLSKSPVNIAHGFLQNFMGVFLSSADALLEFISPTCVLESMSLSSLADRARVKQHQLYQSSWSLAVDPESTSMMRFPEKHEGILKINAAARTFSSSLSDLLHLGIDDFGMTLSFKVYLSSEAAVVCKANGHLAAPFTWRSEGLRNLGYSMELEFNGLIRCSFNGFGSIIMLHVSFDACSLVRHCHRLVNHRRIIEEGSLE